MINFYKMHKCHIILVRAPQYMAQIFSKVLQQLQENLEYLFIPSYTLYQK